MDILSENNGYNANSQSIKRQKRTKNHENNANNGYNANHENNEYNTNNGNNENPIIKRINRLTHLNNTRKIFNLSISYRYKYFNEVIKPTLPQKINRDNSRLNYILNFHGGQNMKLIQNIKFKIPNNFYIMEL